MSAVSYTLSKRLKHKGNVGGIKLTDIMFVLAEAAVAVFGYLTLKNFASAGNIYPFVIAIIILLLSIVLIIPGKYEENLLIKYGRYRRFKNTQQHFPYRRGTPYRK